MDKKNKLRVLSGIQPSGNLHIGNYFGMMERMINYQTKNELFCFIADYHALTSSPSSQVLSSNTFNAACDFLALGLDPDKTTFWIQSDVPEVTELAWILSSQTGVGLMGRSTTYKDKITKGIKPNMGLFSYPILMAADILLFNTTCVPVGIDQKQHVEIARDIAQNFNKIFGDVFVVPEIVIQKNQTCIVGIDGRKMSKNYNNTIPLFEDESVIKKRAMSIKTESLSVDAVKDPDSCSLFSLFQLFASSDDVNRVRNHYLEGGLAYGTLKLELLGNMLSFLTPFRERYDHYMSNSQEISLYLTEGAAQARSIARETLSRVRSAIGLYSL